MLTEYKTLFSNKNFIYLWVSQLLSQLIINFVNFILLYKIFSETESSIATSFLWVTYALPAIIIGPIAAASVDMLNRKKTLMWTNLLQSITILAYAFLQERSLFLLYTVALLYSLFNQFYVPAEIATLPSVVKTEFLAQANGLFFMTQQASVIIGFGIAGLILEVLGFFFSLILASVFLFMAFISVSFLPKMRSEESIPHDFEDAIAKFFNRISEGYHFIKEDKLILYPFLLIIILQISLAVIAVNAPVLALQVFRIPLHLAGALLVVPAGIGAMIGSVFVPRLLKRGYRKRKIIDYSLMSVGLVLLLLTFLIPLVSQNYGVLVSIVLILLLGLSFVGVLIPAQTFLQEKTPGGLRGRVFGNIWFVSTIATVFPIIVSGAVTEIFGARFITLMLGVVFISVYLFLKSRKFILANNSSESPH